MRVLKGERLGAYPLTPTGAPQRKRGAQRAGHLLFLTVFTPAALDLSVTSDVSQIKGAQVSFSLLGITEMLAWTGFVLALLAALRPWSGRSVQLTRNGCPVDIETRACELLAAGTHVATIGDGWDAPRWGVYLVSTRSAPGIYRTGHHPIALCELGRQFSYVRTLAVFDRAEFAAELASIAKVYPVLVGARKPH